MTNDSYTQRFAQTADGTTLSVREVAGEGSLIVALHGFTGAGVTMIPLLEGIRNGRPAVAVDLVGHGESDSPEYLDAYSMASVVDQVLSIIGPRNPETVHLVGYSMGGRVALSMAARAPWYFASITSLSATPGLDDPVERAARHDADLALAAHVEDLGVDAFIDEWLQKPLFSSYVAGLDGEARACTVEVRTANSPHGLANSLRGTGTGAMPPVWNGLANLRSPLLAVAGALDSTYVQIANDMTEAVPSGQVSIIADAGHVVHEEKLDDISSLVATFLQSCDQDER